MRKHLLLVALTSALGACNLDIPDLDNPGLDQLEKNPSRANISAAAVGLLIGSRGDHAEPNGYVSILGIIGRESYNFDVADDRFVTELLASDHLDPGSPRFGGNFWTAPYKNIRHANVLLHALERAGGLLTEQELLATRAFAETIQALDFLILVNTRDENGAAIDVDRARDGELAPLVAKEEVFDHIASLLDEGHANLAAVDKAQRFPFQLPSGFDGFATPAEFARFNRALKARVEVYRGRYGAAIDALALSFLSADASAPALDRGVYYTYGSSSGDRLNGLVDPNLFAHPSLVTDAEVRPGGGLDNRVQHKIFTKEPRRLQMLESNFGFARYRDPRAPAPIIRNEELLLLRAEALIGLGRVDEAAKDINFVRVHAGGLAVRNDLTIDNIVDELLTQRRYSLLFEGGHRWLDMRRFHRLDRLPLDVFGHTVHVAFPIPVQEQDPR